MSGMPGVRRLDLHLHSNLSDGLHPPDEVLRRCAAGGLDAVALTDHDLTGALPVGDHVVDGRTIRVIGGAEVSGCHEGVELHLLVYFRGEVPEAFRTFCRDRAVARATRYATAVERLDLPDLAGPDAAATAGERSLTRHHLARALVEAGHADDLRDAFRRYARTGDDAVPACDLPFTEAIAVARAHGGLTSWAHPPLRYVEAWLADFVAAGLHAIETVRPGLRGEERRRLRAHAKRHGLLVTGGSDWHGWTSEQPGLFYVERGEVAELLAWLAA